MEKIALLNKISFLAGKEENENTVVIDPLFPGYGMTLGNSLRRVLLSSLPGSAVVGVKIKGADHEFMPLQGVKEDVLEIVLNIKQLRVKTFIDEEIRLELKVKGKKVVTAADIEKNSQLEIKNPDLVIANLTESKAELDVEIFIRSGRGYKMADGVKRENKELGFIETDSIFSPVVGVSLDVENTRVGKMTNWDRLLLNIKTDGTISPKEAFKESVKILVDQYNSFLEKIDEPAEKKEKETEKIEEVVEEEDKKEDKKEKKKKKD